MCSAECRPGDEGGAYLHATIFFRIVSAAETEVAPKVWQCQWMRESAAMTRMMPGAAEVMPEVSPVPLL